MTGWTQPDAALYDRHGFEVYRIPNGEGVGAVAHTTNWRWVVSPGCREYATEHEAKKAVEADANARLWFRERTGDA